MLGKTRTTYEELIFMVAFVTGLDAKCSGELRESERPRGASGEGSTGSEERPRVGLRACEVSGSIQIKDQSALIKMRNTYLETQISMLEQCSVLVMRQSVKSWPGLTFWLVALVGCVTAKQT